jgi:hypothetical protein
MKVEIFDNDSGTNIELIPETIEENNTLLRMVKNSKSEKPQMFFSFPKDKDPYCNLWVKKITLKKQSNSISNGR